MRTLIAACLVALFAGQALADDDDAPRAGSNREKRENPFKVDTEHIFGFNEGGDIGEVSDKELEKESAIRFGKAAGRYVAVSTLVDFKYVPFDGVLVSPGILLSAHSITGSS
jgi:hypothetical protein